MTSLNTSILPDEAVINKIYLVRGVKIMVDRDLAQLYGVETKAGYKNNNTHRCTSEVKEEAMRAKYLERPTHNCDFIVTNIKTYAAGVQ